MVTKVPSSISALPAISCSRLQILRQDAVFDRAEEGGRGPGEKQRRQVHPGVLEPQGQGPEHHRRQVEELDPAGEDRLVMLVGKLPRECREQEIGQHEKRQPRLHEECRVEAEAHGQVEGDEDGDAVPDRVVVEGADRLGHEQGQETRRLQDRELALGLVRLAAHVKRLSQLFQVVMVSGPNMSDLWWISKGGKTYCDVAAANRGRGGA
jgi:hypothetical protein